MQQTIKHLMLANKGQSLVLVDCEIYDNRISVGCIYIDNCTSDVQEIFSGLNHVYVVKLPKLYLNVTAGIQFNTTLLRV